MLTLLSIISAILRAIGFVETADKVWAAHEERVRAQNVANSPLTDQEWSQKAKDGDL